MNLRDAGSNIFCRSGRIPLPAKQTQQTRDIRPMLFQCWASVTDAGPTLKQHRANVSCLTHSLDVGLILAYRLNNISMGYTQCFPGFTPDLRLQTNEDLHLDTKRLPSSFSNKSNIIVIIYWINHFPRTSTDRSNKSNSRNLATIPSAQKSCNDGSMTEALAL